MTWIWIVSNLHFCQYCWAKEGLLSCHHILEMYP